MNDHWEYVPLQPLLDRVECNAGRPLDEISDFELAAICGVSTRTINRWKHTQRVRVVDTDRIAISLGWHPAAIWGAKWYIETAQEAAA